MITYPELEIGLHRQGTDEYAVEMRFRKKPEDVTQGDDTPPPVVRFDIDNIRAAGHDVLTYGQRLINSLFAQPAIQEALASARGSAQDRCLRLRLFIGPGAPPELHALWWETLCDPQDSSSFLIARKDILFSRYLNNFDWQLVRLRPRPLTGLRALVMIANPSDVTDCSPEDRLLAPLDVKAELEQAKANLGSIPVTGVISPGSATLPNLSAHLSKDYDILYLICHGVFLEGHKPWLWLENETGRTQKVAYRDLLNVLRELGQEGPRLVVLVSPQSTSSSAEAHSDDKGALAALGSRLLQAGVPAVLAMQHNVTMQTVTQFMPVFFRELQEDGQIDQAMAKARSQVQGRPDWWVPVLMVRLKSGRIWYKPGFQPEAAGKWPALLQNIRDQECTPILGPGLTEPLLGTHREIAQRWAKTYNFPLAPHQRDELPQVAQYLSTCLQPVFPLKELLKYLGKEMQRRYKSELSAEMLNPYGGDLHDPQHGLSLDKLISAVGAQYRKRNEAEPHKVLATLPLPLYITTDFSNLLADALKDAGRKPEVELCSWNEEIKKQPSIFKTKGQDYRPTPDRPLVYHLFGRLDVPGSIVLTEDDYFDYLTGVTRNKNLIPNFIRRALVDTSLLFLGFQLEEWNFRVLFSSIMSQEGREMRQNYIHVAAQIDPEEGRILEPARARQYLESYFQRALISIYWGSPEDFTRELSQKY